MVRHVVVFEWVPDVTEDQVAAVERALATLPGLIPEIRRYEFGRDLGLAGGTSDFAVVADFDDVDGYRAYAAQPEHRRIATELIGPIAATAVRAQYEVA